MPSANVAQAAPVTIDIALSGANENPPVNSPGSGFARITFDESTKVLTYAVTINGIAAGEVTAAHIHRGPVGVNGPIVYNLSTVGFTQVAGSITLTDADVADLKAGNFYINAHSMTNPGGFARGQINLTPDASIQASVNAATAAWNRKDVDAFLGYFTREGALNEFGAETYEEILEVIGEVIGQEPIVRSALSNVTMTGPNSATGLVDLHFGPVIERNFYNFLQVGGVWKINGGEVIDTPVPAGTAVVPVTMREFNFAFDKSAAASGNIAFRGTNAGQQYHEIALAKIPQNANLQQLLAEDDPAGIEFVGNIFFEPGESRNMVFSQPLSAGRYAMVCFIPDEATGTPHAFLGMATDFQVTGGGGGGTVRPPSTGDGGLVGSSHSENAMLIGGIVMLVLASGLGLSTVRIHRD